MNEFTTTVEETVTAMNMFTLLQQQLSRFETISYVVREHSLYTGSMFVPQVISKIDTLLSTDSELVSELVGFLDIVYAYSFLVYGDTKTYMGSIVEAICETRTSLGTVKSNQVIGGDNVSDFTLEGNIENFLNGNKLVLAIYIYSLIHFSTFSGDE